ncbi:MAG: SDR family NAD(P)-dependent oxidoreductase [Anaerolineae bacterium]|nr:SDR family NAD(P)-dependent oxidoreductase [Anaerolineae bacterium]
MSQPITSSSVFVVSGGARGITAYCVEVMAEYYQCKFILMGRSELHPDPDWAQSAPDEASLKTAAMNTLKARGEKPTPTAVQNMTREVLASREIRETLARITQKGGHAEYLSADITNANAVKAGIQTASQKLGRVTGIIHGAGNLADKLIENKTQKDFETVYSAKVDGLKNLLEAVSPNDLQHLVLFSSVAGFFGNVGQTDYSIANEILNKTAYLYQKRYPHLKIVSINWGPWDAGMVTPQLKAYFAENNIQVIPLDTGAAMLIHELENQVGDNAVQVVVGSGIAFPAILPSDDLKTHRLHRVLRLEDSPFLQDHVVGGSAVLPMVSAMSWMSSAAEGLYTGYKFYAFEAYKVLKGVVFDENVPPRFVLELKDVEKSADQIMVDAMISSTTSGGKPRFHYSTRLILRKKLPPMPTFSPDLNPRDNIAGQKYYDDYTLFHGFAFKGVDRVLNIQRESMIVECTLPNVPASYQGQFPVQAFNYYSVDIGLQSMGIYVKHFFGAGSLPLRAGAGEHYGDVRWGEKFYVTLDIVASTETKLVAAIRLHDAQGRVYRTVRDAEVTIRNTLDPLFRQNRLPKPLA